MPEEFGVDARAIGLADERGLLTSSAVTLLLAEMRLRYEESKDA